MYIMRIWNTFFDYVIVLPEFEPIMPENMHFFAGFSESKPVKFFWDDVLLWEEGLHPNLWEIPFWA